MQAGSLLVLFIGIISCQRFLLPDLYAYVCLLPLVMALVKIKDFDECIFWTLITLFSKSDMGGDRFTETSVIVRNAIHLIATILCLRQTSVVANRTLIVFLSVLPIISSAFAFGTLDGYWFIRDSFNLLIVTLSLLKRSALGKINRVVRGVSVFSLGCLGSEILNIIFIPNAASMGYLSYDSLKCAVTFFSIYSIINMPWTRYVPAVIGTLLVVTNYSSRMLMISYVCVVSIILIRKSKGKALVAIALISAVLSSFFSIYNSSSEIADLIDSKKVLILFQNLKQLDFTDFGSVINYFSDIDIIRFGELRLISELGLVKMIIGCGLGSPLIDLHGYTSNAIDDGNSYSLSEIMSGHLYRLHDSWSYLGIKIGLIYYAYIVYRSVQPLISKAVKTLTFLSSVSLLILVNGSFTVAGILAYGLTMIAVNSISESDNNKKYDVSKKS